MYIGKLIFTSIESELHVSTPYEFLKELNELHLAVMCVISTETHFEHNQLFFYSDSKVIKPLQHQNKDSEKYPRFILICAILRPVYTGDFCRAIQCNFCRVEVATSKWRV